MFVAHAGELNALCLLRKDGTFRYVADLDSSAAPPLGYAPAAWSPDGQSIAFVAPHQYPPGVPRAWLQPDFQHSVYIATLDDPTPRAVGDTEADQVTWREDGQLLGLLRAGSDGWLNVRLLNSASATGQQVLQLPLKPSNRYAATWDMRQARVLLANQTAAGAIEYWLASFGLDGDG